ncbi:hypothetical protein HLB23_01085 [Nocardia uniformis]|uniref:Uncharacterized protein n=1 Tax=Nocardia uniformis TaxID=53432 RepID=A0A849BU22_9NOCA|nr:hypothetical protein [Nocardia uniformis]NNH68488.1 hypothetical protein [Nocardia uniformis]
MTDVTRPGPSAGAAISFRRPRHISDLDAELSGPAGQFVSAADLLRRRLFDVGLPLHILLEDLEQPEITREQTRAIITGLADELDVLLRESGLAMLALPQDRYPMSSADGHPDHRRSHDGRDHHRYNQADPEGPAWDSSIRLSGDRSDRYRPP